MRKNNSQDSSRARTRAITKRTSKRRGELAELAFVFKAASLGFTVAKPYGDSDRYDFILDSGQRLIRVQVKSASRLSQGTYFLTTQRCCNGVAIPYTPDEIDFLVGYIFPEDAWVLIPVATLAGRKSIHIFPRDRAQQGIYAHYREAWCQLACARSHSASSRGQPVCASATHSLSKAKTNVLEVEPRCHPRENGPCPLRPQRIRKRRRSDAARCDF